MLATIVCSRRFDARFFSFPASVQEAIERALHDLAARLDTFSHQKLKGVNAYKLRVGNYRVIYDSIGMKGGLMRSRSGIERISTSGCSE